MVRSQPQSGYKYLNSLGNCFNPFEHDTTVKQANLTPSCRYSKFQLEIQELDIYKKQSTSAGQIDYDHGSFIKVDSPDLEMNP